MSSNKHSKKALITGVSGQDGYYLSDHLLKLGYQVYGLINEKIGNQDPDSPISKITLVSGNLTDYYSLVKALQDIQPDEIYNLGGMSSVANSWDDPLSYNDVNTNGVYRILSAMQQFSPRARLYQACSSEMFGHAIETPQTELTPFRPRNPYGVSKVGGFWYAENFREHYGLYACSGILYNHESPIRPSEFVTRKITLAAAKIKLGQQLILEIGNPNSQRDWGFAGDYVKAMHLMLQQPQAEDYIIATGKLHSVKEFVERAFEVAGIPVHWEQDQTHAEDNRPEECQLIAVTKDGKKVVRVSEKFFRLEDRDTLVGDASKAKSKLGWEPTINFEQLVEMMVKHDLAQLSANYHDKTAHNHFQ